MCDGGVCVAHDQLDVGERRLDATIASLLLVIVVLKEYNHSKITNRPAVPRAVLILGSHEASEGGGAEGGDVGEEDAVERRGGLEGGQ